MWLPCRGRVAMVNRATTPRAEWADRGADHSKRGRTRVRTTPAERLTDKQLDAYIAELSIRLVDATLELVDAALSLAELIAPDAPTVTAATGLPRLEIVTACRAARVAGAEVGRTRLRIVA